jgi:hypothetical protein
MEGRLINQQRSDRARTSDLSATTVVLRPGSERQSVAMTEHHQGG